jgi:DNA-directed RNA polymerase subunit alpha
MSEQATIDQTLDLERPMTPGRATLRVRALRACRAMDVTTLRELAGRSAEELASVKNCGPSTIGEIRDRLAEFGLKLRGE